MQQQRCIVLIQGNEKCLIKFAGMSGKMLGTVIFLSRTLFNIIMDLCLLLCFCIFFKRQIETVSKVFMYKVVLANLKFTEHINA